MKQLMTILLILIMSNLLFGAWISEFPMTFNQTDGTEINCYTSGDEFHNWLHDKDGYTIIQNDAGDFVWAIKSGDKVIPSNYRVDLYNPAQLGIRPKVNISNEEYLVKRNRFLDTTRDIPSRAPTQGVINNIVIFIRFANDTEFNQQITPYEYMLNDSTETGNSMKNYFREVSYNTLSVTSSFYPYPENNMVISYQDIHPRSYFLPYSTNNPNGYQDNERTTREHQLLKRAVDATASLVPTDLNLDGDNDNRVDNVCFIIKGSAGAWADLLWPHRWSLFSENAYINGKRVWDFNFQLQTFLTSSGSSVLAHEMFHSLGAPDLYRYVNEANPIGAWDLMASNTNPPQHMSSYMKYRYSTWVNQIPVINQSGNYSLKSVKSSTNNCYRINSPFSNSEYFVIEYRKNNMGIFDSQIYGSGLLVYRVNGSADGDGNAQGPPDELYVYRPGGTVDYDGNIQSAFLSLESGRTQINDATDPNTFLSNGAFGGLNIYNIGATDADSITFTVQLFEANTNDIDEDFENQWFIDYDWQNFSLSPWTIASTGYQSSFSAKSGAISDNQKSEIVMMADVQFGFVQFYYKTSTQSNADYLKFYIDNELMGQWSGIEGWQHTSYPVSNGIHTFKWAYEKNQSGSAGDDTVYIDRIGFPEFNGPVYYPPRNLQANLQGRFVELSWNKPIVSNLYDLGPILSYSVFCNNTLLTSVPPTDSMFVHGPILGGSNTYSVKAVYLNAESEFSNVVTMSIPFSEPLNLTGVFADNAIQLSWNPPAYVDRVFIGYRVYRNNVSITSTPFTELTYTDSNITYGQTYSYTVRAVYQNPNGISPHSNTLVINANGTDNPNPLTFKTELKGNYPNPFNPSTSVAFSLKDPSKVNISIYNIKGELVKVLVNETKNPGHHSVVWNGKNSHNKTVSAGIYMLKMECNEYIKTKKIIMIK